MTIAGDRVSRGKRLQEIQEACGYGVGKKADNAGFAVRLNEAARELGLEENWHAARLSKIRNGTQDLSIEDATVVSHLDKERRGWTWVSFGVTARPGDDPYAVLAKQAKRPRKVG